MRNRARCRKCRDILESFHRYDFVMCSCGSISISGGDYAFECAAKDFNDFLRIDDNGNEIEVKFQNKDSPVTQETISKPSRETILASINDMKSQIEKMPEEALRMPLNHYDFISLLSLLSFMLQAD